MFSNLSGLAIYSPLTEEAAGDELTVVFFISEAIVYMHRTMYQQGEVPPPLASRWVATPTTCGTGCGHTRISCVWGKAEVSIGKS